MKQPAPLVRAELAILHDALSSKGWARRDLFTDLFSRADIRPGTVVRIWSKKGERDIGEKAGRDYFREFEHYALYGTSAVYRAKVDADIAVEREQGIGDCWECPITDRHVDGVCVEVGCDCPSKTPPPKLEPKR